MLIEAIGKPFVYRWPGGEVRLEPGEPVELPPERAAKLLARAPGKVRCVRSDSEDFEANAQAGDTITWDLPDLGQQDGVVDFLSSDPDGSRWAYVTLSDGSCAAVNLKIASKVIPE